MEQIFVWEMHIVNAKCMIFSSSLNTADREQGKPW